MKHPTVHPARTLAFLLLAFLGTSQASGQTLSWSVAGTNRLSNLGRSLDVIPDFDGDGADDLLVSSPRSVGLAGVIGPVEVLSGRTGARLLSFGGISRYMALPSTFPLRGQRRRCHGDLVRCLGDVNGDGFTDFAVNAPEETVSVLAFAAGSVFVYSGRDGRRLYRVDGPTGDAEFGGAMDALGDVNGDGAADFIVGANDHNGTSSSGSISRAGAAYVVSGHDGSFIYEYEGPAPFARLGRAVGGLGDVDADGVNDFAIVTANPPGALPPSFGVLSVYSGATGVLIYDIDTNTIGSQAIPSFGFGAKIRQTGDIDGDGTDDFVVGDRHARVGGSSVGAVFVFSGQAGQLIRTHAGVNSFEELGADVRADVDLDGDGLPDLVIGNPAPVLSGPATPRVVAYSAATGLLLFEFVLTPPRISFGSELAVGDFNGDGVPDLAVSSPSTNAPLLQSGLLEMFER